MAKKQERVIENVHIAQSLIRGIKPSIDKDNMQVCLVRMAYDLAATDQEDLAYNLINEGFNQCFVAGYKYLEVCERLGRTGEFTEVARKNPLIHLND